KGFDTVEKGACEFNWRQRPPLQKLSGFTDGQVTQLGMGRRHSATSALGVPVWRIHNGEIFRRQIEVVQHAYLRGIEIEHGLQVLEFSRGKAHPYLLCQYP